MSDLLPPWSTTWFTRPGLRHRHPAGKGLFTTAGVHREKAMEHAAQLEVVEELKKLLFHHVQQGNGDEARYTVLRRQLLQERRLFSHIPAFIKSDTTLQEVRQRSQRLDGSTGNQVTPYAVRRQWLVAEFQPLLDILQRPQLSSVEEVLAESLGTVDSAHVRNTWDKAIERRQVDPDGAITIARSLIEAVCKHVLGAGNYDKAADLPVLYKQASKYLGLTDDGYADEALKQIMRGCVQIVHGVGEFRNKMGDAHGKGPLDPAAETLQAELAVSVAGAMATFLISTWDEQKARAGKK